MERVKKSGHTTPGLPNQNIDGVDLAHLRANLRLTPTERVQKAQAAAQFQYEVKLAAQAAGLRKAH